MGMLMRSFNAMTEELGSIEMFRSDFSIPFLMSLRRRLFPSGVLPGSSRKAASANSRERNISI
jgi:hypothetical protein